MDWLDLLAVQGTLKSLLQYHTSKASILWHSTFFIVQLSHPYMTTGKTIALTRRTFDSKVMSLLFNMLSRLVTTFLQRNKCLLISWLQLPSALIFYYYPGRDIFFITTLVGGAKHYFFCCRGYKNSTSCMLCQNQPTGKIREILLFSWRDEISASDAPTEVISGGSFSFIFR